VGAGRGVGRRPESVSNRPEAMLSWLRGGCVEEGARGKGGRRERKGPSAT
jgi:hypothetical protein